MKPRRLPYVHEVRRGVRMHFYFRRPLFPSVKLPGPYGSPEFLAAYAKAVAGSATPVGQGRDHPHSMNGVASSWCASSQFRSLKPASQQTYRRLMKGFLAKHGKLPVTDLEPHHIVKLLERMNDAPAQANALRNVLRQLLQHAFETGIIRENPARDVKRLRYVKQPFPAWSEAEIAAFQARWPVGTRARLALELLLCTGQRRSDVIRMGPQHVKDGWIEVVQQKTGTRLLLPMHPDLRAVLAAHEGGHLAFLVTEAGRPFASGNAFFNWFAEVTKAAGIEGRSPHGLRKSAAVRLAQAECTPSMIAAITGHKTLSEVARYTRDVEQPEMAQAAIDRLAGRGGKTGT